MIRSRRGVAVMALASALACVPAAVTTASGTEAKPDADTTPVTQVTGESAILQGRVQPHLLVTTYWFEYGPTNSYGQSTATQSTGILDVWATVAKEVTGLTPNTKYHYRLVASTPLGTKTASDKSFTTGDAGAAPADPPATADPTDPGAGDGGDPASGDSTPFEGGGTTRGGADDSRSDSRGAETPKLGETVGIAATDGVVLIRKPHDKTFGAIDPDGTVPTGTVVDTRHGKIELTSALPDGSLQTGTFWGGLFEVRQAPGGRGYAELVLRGRKPRGCPRRKRSATASKRRRGASLWGSDRHGRFRTRGHNSVATVRGTTWLTTERCSGTLTFVREGTVVVRVKHGRKVTLHAGEAYLARKGR